MISFIVPVQYTKSNYILDRAKKMIKYFESSPHDVELIIADSSKIKILKSKKHNIKIVHLAYSKETYSPAKSRNKCINYCSKEFIFFLDVDLLFSEKFISGLLSKITEKNIEKKFTFLMFPCFYLTKKGTSLFTEVDNQSTLIDKFRESYLLGENIYVERLAVNSSAILIKKEYFIQIGMFNEDFFGHGGEDFEFLHRLASYSPHSAKNTNYYLDKVEQFPSNYKGFRQYLAYYSFPYLFTNLVLVHQWHERPLLNLFYMHRIKNEKLLIETMKKYDKQFYTKIWKSKKLPEDFQSFLFNLLKSNGYHKEKYIGLSKLQNNVQIKRPMSAKIRKLITRPKLFFTDMLKKRKKTC